MNLKKFWNEKCDKRTAALILLTIALAMVMGAFNPSRFYSVTNFQSMGRQLAEIGIYALAMFVVVVSGGLNLSIVAVANFSAICGGSIMQGLLFGDIITDPTARLIVGFVVSILVGILSGVINGYFVAGLGLAAVLVTSASSQLFQGAALIITKGNAIVGAPPVIEALGTGELFGIPYLIIVVAACYIVCHFLFQRTGYGEQCRLLGANATANKYSGNPNFKILMKSYILSGVFSAIGGLISYSRMAALRPDYGPSLTSTAMLVVLMGGAWIVAGGGKVLNIFISLFCMQILGSGLTLAGAINFVRNTVWGILLIVILILGSSSGKKFTAKLKSKIFRKKTTQT